MLYKIYNYFFRGTWWVTHVFYRRATL